MDKSFSPQDWIELIKAISIGIAGICVPIATAYIMIVAARIKTVGTDIKILEKNTNSISERNQAIAEKLGISMGIAQERASNLAGAVIAATHPVPVSDEKTEAAVEKVVDAIEALPNKNLTKEK